MKKCVSVFGTLLLVIGCASISDLEGQYSTRGILTYSELPRPVRESIELEAGDSQIVEIKEWGTSPTHYFQLKFEDGTERRYNPDGTSTHRGIL